MSQVSDSVIGETSELSKPNVECKTKDGCDGEEDGSVNTNKSTDSDQDYEQIQSYIKELQCRFEQKLQDRSMHDVNNFEYPDDVFFAKLDTSIKKNTAFVKKLRNMTEAQKENIMKDLSNLNLSRYISEIANALVETKIKINEIPMCIKICSFLHLRYQDFSSQLLDSWIKNLPRKPTDTFNASKMRIDIRMFAELVLSGIFKTKDGLPILGNLLTILTSGDKENHNNLNIVLSFCRQYVNEFAGLTPRKMNILAEKCKLEIPKCDFLSLERQKGVRNLLKDYYHSLVNHVLNDHKKIQNMAFEMNRILETRGEVSKQRQEIFESKQLDFQKLWSSTQQFGDIIDEDLPELDSNSSNLNSNEVANSGVVFDFNNRFRNENNSGLIWEDEETRTFYENLPDLKSLIPAILYKDSLKESQVNVKENANSNNNNTSESNTANEEGNATEKISDSLKNIDFVDEFINSDSIQIVNENDEIEDIKNLDGKITTDSEKSDCKMQIQNKSFNPSKDQLDLFFASLLNCVNREFIDKAALTFATTFNTKNNRKSLVKALITVPRTRLDLLPFYSRFVAQLNPIMPSVATDLVYALKGQFKYNFIKKDQVNIESKVKITRFIGELVKFGIFPKSDVHYILKTLLSDFHHHHINMTCNLFETCGQYLYRSPDSFHMTKHLLDQMMRLKSRMVLDSRYEIMIENAFYCVNPPEEKISSRIIQTKPVVYLYIENIIYKELNKKTLSKVISKLRKIDWKNKDTSSFAVECLSSVWNIKFYNISALAHLLVALHQYQSWVVPRVIDTILEEIRLGMQMNSVEYNQRRIAFIKYFAECFNYNLIDSTLLFTVLYSLITYGVNYSDINKSELDPPLNLMRLRLVAQVLHSCGMFLSSCPAKKKLDYYIYFYQRYYWLKKSYLNSLPSDKTDINAQFYIDSIFKDVIQFIKPKFRIADSYKTACRQLENRLKELAENAKEILPNAKISIDKVLNPNAVINNKNNSLEPIEEEDSIDEEPISEYVDSDSDDGDSNDAEEEIDYSEGEDINEPLDEEEEILSDNNNKDGSDLEEDVPKMKAPVIVKCEEDDDFQKNFDRMLTENLISRSQETVRSNVEITIPIERETEKKNKIEASSDINSFSMSLNDQNDGQSEKTFNFRVMTRNSKSSKPLLKTVKVSPDSDLVQHFRLREEEFRAEKEAVKKLILNINERRELEDCGSSPNRSLDGGKPASRINNNVPTVNGQTRYGTSYSQNYRKRF